LRRGGGGRGLVDEAWSDYSLAMRGSWEGMVSCKQ